MKEHSCFSSNRYLSYVSCGQKGTEANLSRTSAVWECVPGQQINEADGDPATNRKLMFSCRQTNCSWANSPTHFRRTRADANQPCMFPSYFAQLDMFMEFETEWPLELEILFVLPASLNIIGMHTLVYICCNYAHSKCVRIMCVYMWC